MAFDIGIRWDDESQNLRLKKAKEMKLINYVEVNYPIAKNECPKIEDLPLYAHSAYNGLCSAFGINESLVNLIKSEADKYDSPWIGEHLSWIAPEQEGALGYVFNTIYNDDFFNITINNIEKIKRIYNRPIALELGPQYTLENSDYNEVEFHLKISEQTGCPVILDLTHLLISNNNLKRKLDYGIKEYKKANTIEVHVAGIRKSVNGYWHDCHDQLPDENTLELLTEFCIENKTLKAITFEHTPFATEQSFFEGLSKIHKSSGS